MVNIGKIKSSINDEFRTPIAGVYAILKYLKLNTTIWCPFDTIESNFVKVLKLNGHKVIYSHKESHDFFKWQPDERIDYIISNPPYSIKDDILERLYSLQIPFAMLLPITSLEGIRRGRLFRQHGIELLVLDRRINFIYNKATKNNWFNTSYFCYRILPQKLIFTTFTQE